MTINDDRQPEPSTTDAQGATVEPQGASSPVAGAATPEDTTDYQALIGEMQKTMQETVSALKTQNESLQRQIGILIRNGANQTSPAQPAQAEQQGTPEGYKPLADLGAEIGKRDYGSSGATK